MLTPRPPREDGHPAKAVREDLRDEPKTIRLCVEIERALVGQLKNMAFSEEKTMTDLVIEAVKWRLSKGPK